MSNGNTIVRIITNNDSNTIGWILESDYEKYFSSDELANTITPYKNFVQGLPGFISLSVNESGNTLVAIQTYDTAENANASYQQQFSNNANSIATTRHTLIKNKLSSLGSNTTITISII